MFLAVAFLAGSKTYATYYHREWSKWSKWSEWSECKLEDKRVESTVCGQYEGTKTSSRTRTCEKESGWGWDECSYVGQKDTEYRKESCTVDFGQCEEEGNCPTECGLESSEVPNGSGGYKQCEATPACEEDRCSNLEDVQTEVPEGYIEIDGICAVKEDPKKDEPKENTFHKDTRCLDTTPPTPAWAYRYPADGGLLANWSAEGGSEVDIEVSNGAGEWEYKYYGLSNDGHEVLPNVAMSQLYRIRTVNGCKSSDWFYDPITSRLPFIR